MKVLVYGATGSQQNPVVHALIKRGHQVRAITHQAGKVSALEAEGAEGVVADMADYEALLDANRGIDAVSLLVPFFLVNPADGIQYAKNAIDAAIAQKVKLLVWNSSGFIPHEKVGNPSIDLRIDVLNYLKASGLPFIVLQPSVYAENLLGPWTAPFVANEQKVAYPTPEEMPVGWIATQDVAEFVVEALQKPELAGEVLLISGVENLTGKGLAEKFSSGLQKPITYHPLPPKAFGKILDGLFGEGAGDGAAAVYQEIADTKKYPPMHVPMEGVLAKIPVKMTRIEDWVAQHQGLFQQSA
jgi:uncharacterized protein YbjT (DUF2867 family)